jgi:hypothetical protein
VDASTVTYPEDGVEVEDAVYVKVVVPVAPLESKAVIVYVPDSQAALPPALVAYVNAPPAPAETVASSTGLGEPPFSVTVITTLSGSEGVGVTWPVIVYAWTPDNAVPEVGLEKVIVPVAAEANIGDRIRAIRRGAARSCSFIVSPYEVRLMGVVGADTAWLAVVIAEKVTVYVPTGTVVKKSWRNTVAVWPAATVRPPTST